MRQVYRRALLKAVPLAAVPIAGCGGDDGGDGGGNGNGNGGSGGNGGGPTPSPTPTPSGPTVEQYLKIQSHEWQGYRLNLTVENVSDTDLGFVQVDSAVYEQDTRIGTMYANIGELAAGTNVNAEIDYTVADVDGSLCDGTRYTITSTVNVGSEQYEHTYEYPDAEIC